MVLNGVALVNAKNLYRLNFKKLTTKMLMINVIKSLSTLQKLKSEKSRLKVGFFNLNKI